MSFTLFPWARKQRTVETIAIFDIGSARISGALVELRRDKPTVLFTYTADIAIETDTTMDRFTNAMLGTLQDVATVLERMAKRRIVRSHCFLSSVWFVSQTRTITFTKRAPFTVSQKLITELLKQDRTQYMKEQHEPLEALEQHIITFSVNGYPTKHPIGKRTTSIAMDVFTSMSPKTILEKIEDTIEKYFHVPTPIFHSRTFSFYTTIRDTFTEVDDYLLVQVDGEISDISIVKDDVLRESYLLPFGEHTVWRHLAAELRVSIPEAVSLFQTLQDDHAQARTKRAVGKVLKHLEKSWVSGFQNAIGELCCDVSLPSTVFLLTDSVVANWFSDIIKGEEFHQHLVAEKEFRVVVIRAKTVHGLCAYEPRATKNPFITLDAVCLHRLT